MSDVLTISACLSLNRACSIWVLIAASSAFFFSLDSHVSLSLSLLCSSCIQSFPAVILIYALLRVLLGLLCLVNGVLWFRNLYIITVFKSGSAKSLNFAFVRSLHTPDIIGSRIILSFRWSTSYFPACKVIFFKKERNLFPFWSLTFVG